MENRSRRDFLATSITGALGLGVAAKGSPAFFASPSAAGSLAIRGGKPVRTQPFPSWPIVKANDETSWSDVLHTGRWCRLDGTYVSRFEKAWAERLGSKYCLATASGTTALLTSLNALDIGPGDEVLVPPYTFVATINVVLMQHALPVFVDTDRETFQIDATKLEAAITPRTKCILPVHLGGSPADLDPILAVAEAHKLVVLEDACQAHLAEWKHKKVSTLGALGCFSFQASKNLNSGEGGAILTQDEALFEQCKSFYNNGRGAENASFEYVRNGLNHRMTEFQGSLLLSQMDRLEAQSRVRTQNAEYLTHLLKDTPGVYPARMYDGTTRNAYHLYMFRYDPEHFAGLPRDQFLKALQAEGIPCAAGYTPLNKEPFIENTLNARAFQKIYSAQELQGYRDRNACPENDRLCAEAVWFGQTMLLGGKSDMDQIAEAIRKVQQHAAEVPRS